MSNPSIFASEIADFAVKCAHRIKSDTNSACDACYVAHVRATISKVADIEELLDASTSIASRDAVVGNNELVVAGAGADGHGVIMGWRGEGDMTRERLVELSRAAGLDDAWLPQPKDAGVQLRRAMVSVASTQYSAEHERKRDRQTTEEREPITRWMLVSRAVDGAITAGAKYGDIVLVATLYQGGEIVFDGDETLAMRVRTEFDIATGVERYLATDVSRWIGEVLRFRLGAVRYGFGWYVPRRTRQVVEALVESFWGTARWGSDWISPPVPVATSAQLSMGIANGLIAEVDEVIAELTIAREQIRARKDDPKADIGARRAETYMVRLSRVGARVESYSYLLGEAIDGCRASIADAMIMLDGVLEGGTTEAMIVAAQHGTISAAVSS